MDFHPCPKPTKEKKVKKPYYFKPGKKTTEWTKAKQKLNKAFEAVGLFNMCEVGQYLIQFEEHREAIEKHRHWFGWAYAHGDKRDNLVGDELTTLVAGACQDCHNYIEYRPDMREIIETVIRNRRVQPTTYHD